MFGALLLFEDEFIHVVAISFTALILTELVMVALTIRTWHPIMLLAELASILIYLISLIVLNDFFGLKSFSPSLYLIMIVSLDYDFIQSVDFVRKTLVITSVSCLPLYLVKFLRKRFYQKLQ